MERNHSLMKITKSDFGTTASGENIHSFHLENASGAYVEILDFGCRLANIVVPDRNGNMTDICLGLATADDYKADSVNFLGQLLCVIVTTICKIWKCSCKKYRKKAEYS